MSQTVVPLGWCVARFAEVSEIGKSRIKSCTYLILQAFAEFASKEEALKVGPRFTWRCGAKKDKHVVPGSAGGLER
jgi:hypothetical protein